MQGSGKHCGSPWTRIATLRGHVSQPGARSSAACPATCWWLLLFGVLGPGEDRVELPVRPRCPWSRNTATGQGTEGKGPVTRQAAVRTPRSQEDAGLPSQHDARQERGDVVVENPPALDSGRQTQARGQEPRSKHSPGKQSQPRASHPLSPRARRGAGVATRWPHTEQGPSASGPGGTRGLLRLPHHLHTVSSSLPRQQLPPKASSCG